MLIGGLLLFFVAYFYPPGQVIQRALVRQRLAPIESLGLSISLGFAALVPVGFVAYLTEAHLRTINAIWLGVVLASCYLLLRHRRADHSPLARTDWLMLVAQIVVVAVVAVHIALLQTIHQANYSGDYWFHIAQIRYFVDTGRLHNDLPYFAESVTNASYPVNSYYLLHALAARILGQDPLLVWDAIRLPMAAVFTANMLLLFRTLVRRVDGALIAVAAVWAAYLLVPPAAEGWGGLVSWAYAAYPSKASMFVLFPAFAFTCAAFVRTGKPGLIAAGALLALALENWHIQNLQFIVTLCVGSLLGFAVVGSRNRVKRALYFAIGGPALAVAYLAACLPLLPETIREFSLAADFDRLSYMFVELAGRDWLLLSPWHYLSNDPGTAAAPWFVLGLFAIPGVLWVLRTNKVVVAIVGGVSACVLLIVFNPIALKILLLVVAPWTIGRLLWLLPVAESFGILAAQVAARHRARVALGFIVLVGAILAAPLVAPAGNKAILQGDLGSMGEGLIELRRALQAIVPVRATVLSDELTSATLPALWSVTIVTGRKRFVTRHTIDYERKAQDLARFFDPTTTRRARRDIAREYNAEYILVNASTEPQFPRRQDAVEGFVVVHEAGAYSLYAAAEREPGAVRPGGRSPR